MGQEACVMASRRNSIRGWCKMVAVVSFVFAVAGVQRPEPVEAECADIPYTYSSIFNHCYAGGSGCSCVDVYG